MNEKYKLALEFMRMNYYPHEYTHMNRFLKTQNEKKQVKVSHETKRNLENLDVQELKIENKEIKNKARRKEMKEEFKQYNLRQKIKQSSNSFNEKLEFDTLMTHGILKTYNPLEQKKPEIEMVSKYKNSDGQISQASLKQCRRSKSKLRRSKSPESILDSQTSGWDFLQEISSQVDFNPNSSVQSLENERSQSVLGFNFEMIPHTRYHPQSQLSQMTQIDSMLDQKNDHIHKLKIVENSSIDTPFATNK